MLDPQHKSVLYGMGVFLLIFVAIKEFKTFKAKTTQKSQTQNSRTYKRKSRNKCNLYHRANGRIVLPTNTVFNCVRSSGCPYGCYQHYNQIGYNYASPQECKRAQISCINRICGHLCE